MVVQDRLHRVSMVDELPALASAQHINEVGLQ